MFLYTLARSPAEVVSGSENGSADWHPEYYEDISECSLPSTAPASPAASDPSEDPSEVPEVAEVVEVQGAPQHVIAANEAMLRLCRDRLSQLEDMVNDM